MIAVIRGKEGIFTAVLSAARDVLGHEQVDDGRFPKTGLQFNRDRGNVTRRPKRQLLQWITFILLQSRVNVLITYLEYTQANLACAVLFPVGLLRSR